MSLLRILHIDGNRPYAESFQRHMMHLASNAGTTLLFDTVDVYDDALNMLKVRAYGAVICDGAVSGGGALQLLREPLLPVPPVIVLAHNGSEMRAREAFKAGAHDYFPASGNASVYDEIFTSILSAAERGRPGGSGPSSRDAVLAQTAYEFLSIPDGASPFCLVGSHLARLWPGGCILLFSYDQHGGHFVLEDVRGPPQAISALESVFGTAMIGNECCIDTKRIPLHGQEGLAPLGATFSELFCGMIPDEINAALSAQLDEDQSVTYPISCEGGLHGLAILLQARGAQQLDAELVGAYLRQASTAFRRLCLEEHVREQRNELSTFAHTLSHEIRNDLTVIKGFASLVSGAANDDIKGRIIDKVDGLAAFVGQSVALADAGTVVGAPEQLDMGALVDGIAHAVIPESITYTRGPLPPLYADRQRMAQVMRNILQNVVDHAQASKVTVSGTRDNGTCRYVVSDDGIGISGDTHEIFKWGVTTSPHGSGMGLPIVSRIVRAMGGTVYVADTSECGTQMVVAVPYGK